MGLQLCTPVGSIIMHKFLIASCLAVATLASAEADADAYYGSLAATWPASFGYGVQSTCYGCRGHYIGKRSAEADPFYGYGYAAPFYGYGHAVGLGLNNVHGLRHFGSGYGISQLHPSGYSAQHITRLHKREAEADPEADAYYGYGYGLGYGHRLGYGHHLGYHGLGYTHGGYYGHGYGHGYGYGY